MLSRVANSLFWLSRYLERAENTARFLAVTHGYAQDMRAISHAAGDQCWSVAYTLFAQAEPEGQSPAAILRRLSFDEELPNSLLWCVARCRENARGIRDGLSSEMWEELNVLYLFLQAEAEATASESGQLAVLQRVRSSSHLFQGLRDNTIQRRDEWHFLNLGQYLERGDLTTRIVGAMYSHPALVTAAELGHTIDTLHLVATLRSCTAFESFSRIGKVLNGGNVAEFLLLDNDLSRSTEFCIQQVSTSLHWLSGTPLDLFTNDAEQLSGRLVADLRYSDIEEVMAQGLPQFVGGVMGKITSLGQAITRQYFI
jgi:uncharacterized alpha-E superfamily protein